MAELSAEKGPVVDKYNARDRLAEVRFSIVPSSGDFQFGNNSNQ